MYNPSGSDNNHEFIEIYSDELINLSNFIIGDLASNDTLSSKIQINSSYSIIVEDGFNSSGINASIYTIGATIGNNLNNNQDSIYFYFPNGTIIDSMSYTSSMGGNNNGKSLERTHPTATTFEESYYDNGTPGFQNSRFIDPNFEQQIDYTKLSISEFLPNPFGDDKANAPDGEFLELYNDATYPIDLEGLQLKDDKGNTVFIVDTNTQSSTIIQPSDYRTIFPRHGTGFLNNDGFEKIFLLDKSSNIIDQVSYYNSKESLSYALVNGNWQYRIPTPGTTNNVDPPKDASTLKIEKIYDLGSDKIAKFGQTIRVKVIIYKGDTTKNTVKAWAGAKGDKISKVTTFNIYEKYTSHELTIPIQLKPNCKFTYEEGEYQVYLNGYDEETTHDITVEELTKAMCETKVVYTKKGGSKLFEYYILEMPTKIENNKPFITKVELVNNDDEMHEVEIYSYVYRGRTSYSGERNQNRVFRTIPINDAIVVDLENIVIQAEPGDYKFKVKIRKDDQKTQKEITEDIEIFAPNKVGTLTAQTNTLIAEEESSESLFSEKDITFPVKPYVVYESTSEKAKKLAPYFFIGLLILINILLITKKH